MSAMAGQRAPILIFDSGVGGLSVLATVHETLPDQDVVYLADNACFPYGDLSDDQIIQRVLRLVGEANTRFHPALVVIACNTASTLVLDQLRARIKVPVVGVVPAVKPAAKLTPHGRIGLLATPATVRRPYLDTLICDHAANAVVTRIGSSVLVQQAEHRLDGADLDMTLIAQVVTPLCELRVDTVVLGCTHFPLIGDALRQVLPEVEHWVDSGDAVARRVRFLLEGGGNEQPQAAPIPSGGNGSHLQLLFSGRIPRGLREFLAQCGYRDDQWQADSWPTT